MKTQNGWHTGSTERLFGLVDAQHLPLAAGSVGSVPEVATGGAARH
jgi:hypothetical protein